MNNNKSDRYTELKALIQQKEAQKNDALTKLYKARYEAQEQLAKALPKRKDDALDVFDVDEFLASSSELAHLPGYIAELDKKINELNKTPFGKPFDTFMGKVAVLSGENNDEFEKEFMQLANKMQALCLEHIEYTSKLNELERKWLCNPMGNYSNRSRMVYYAQPFFLELFNNNAPIDYQPFN